MKRLWSGIVVLSFVILMGAVASAQVTIHVAHPHGSPSSDGLQAVVDVFNERHDDIEVVLDYVPYTNISQEKLQVLVAGGVAPDVVVLADLLIAEWAAVDGLVNLDPYLERDRFGLDQFWPSSAQVVQWQGHTWALPHTQDARAMLYNKDYFAETGLDADRGPQTLEDLTEQHRLLSVRDADGGYSRVGIVPWAAEGWFYTWGWLFGADFYDEENQEVTPAHPKAVKAMEWLQQFANEYPPEVVNPRSNLWNGDAAMMAHGVWGLGEWRQAYSDFNLGVAPLPPPQGEGPSTWSGIWTLGISSASDFPDAAWEFIKFATGAEGEEIFVTTATNIAANKEAAFNSLDVLTETYGRYFETFLNLMPYSHNRPTMPAGSVYWNELAAAMNRVINEGAIPREALLDAGRKTQQALDEVLASMGE